MIARSLRVLLKESWRAEEVLMEEGEAVVEQLLDWEDQMEEPLAEQVVVEVEEGRRRGRAEEELMEERGEQRAGGMVEQVVHQREMVRSFGSRVRKLLLLQLGSLRQLHSSVEYQVLHQAVAAERMEVSSSL